MGIRSKGKEREEDCALSERADQEVAMTSYINRPQAVRQIKISALPSMEDTELLRLLLDRSVGRKGAGRVAEELIGRFGGLGEAITAEAVELDRVDGLGPTALLDLKLVRELSVRLTRSAACTHPVVSSWSALLAYVRVALAHLPREQFRVLYLDRRNILLRDELIADESAYRPDAVSPAGAGGLTQLMPGTALELGVRDRFDPDENLRGGADYLARQLVRYGDLRLALAAYNAGPGRVARLGRVPDFAETQAYVATVIECFLALTAGRSVTSSRQCAADEGGR